MNRYFTLSVILAFLSACSPKQEKTSEQTEDLESKSLLQGIWLDDDTESPMIRIEGDTLYYADPTAAPVAFKVFDDTLMTYGARTTAYHIEKQSESIFWFKSELGTVIRLSKADTTTDIPFIEEQEVQQPTKEVIQKDHVVFYNNVRYRGYVYINPSQMKVTRPNLSEEGLNVDNVYYDNVIHICVYEGKKKLFSKDITKKEFEGIVPNDFLQWAILSDMEFINVNAEGYQYQATVCIPDGASCYLINLSVATDGTIKYALEQ